MLEPIIIEATSDTPRVELNKEKGIFRFEGKSLPEDVIKFFSPVQS
ncbi:MAG: SiaC family regulatory phosphoprotein, partial [Bacteroidales bacterium]|nr:SiaC family regulatory phosphoprotein [Bacteroidales bacterium]